MGQRPGREEAETLTTQQAQSIVDFLSARAWPATAGRGGNGGQQARVPNLSPTVRAKNRRVEVTLVNRRPAPATPPARRRQPTSAPAAAQDQQVQESLGARVTKARFSRSGGVQRHQPAGSGTAGSSEATSSSRKPGKNRATARPKSKKAAPRCAAGPQQAVAAQLAGSIRKVTEVVSLSLGHHPLSTRVTRSEGVAARERRRKGQPGPQPAGRYHPTRSP